MIVDMSEFNQIVEDFQTQMKHKLQEIIKTQNTKFFEEFEELAGYSVTYALDGFCDGDPCTPYFSSYHSQLFFVDKREEDDDTDLNLEGCDKKYEDLCSFWHEVPTDLMVGIYGSNVEIRFDRDGTVLEDTYDNDN